MDFRAVLGILGFILLLTGGFMLLPLPFALYYGEGDGPVLALSAATTMAAGGGLWLGFKRFRQGLRKREGFLVVASGWAVASLFGCLPFLFSGAIPSFTDAYFETVSGFTTTGSSILSDIEALPKGVLLWRSLTQWIGGLGIIVLSIAILPMLGVGGMQLFSAEATHVTIEKLTPRISQTARLLWVLYCAFTAAETLLLMAGGLSFYDALAHAFTTIATGGFSTKNTSVGAFSPFVHYVVIFFMFISGVSFTLHYRAIMGKDPRVYGKDGEFLLYACLIGGAALAAFASIPSQVAPGVEERFRLALFQVVSLGSSTGFATGDYELWPAGTQLILFFLMVHAGCVGSTSGGLKVMRLLLLLKNGANEMRKLVRPKAVFVVRHNGKAVSPEIITTVQAFFIVYVTVFAAATLVVAASGVDLVTAASAAITAMGNVGPGLNAVGPMDNFGHLPALAKWTLSFCMITGRLELFTVLVLFTPGFWKR